MDTTWIHHGYHMDTTWIQHGYNMDTTWIQHGYNMDTTWRKLACKHVIKKSLVIKSGLYFIDIHTDHCTSQ